MSVRQGSDQTGLFQFTPELVGVTYGFSAYRADHYTNPSHATQLIELRGPITYPTPSKQSGVDLSVYAGSEHLAKSRGEIHEPLGSLRTAKGRLRGSVWIPDEHFATVLTLALSEKARCISIIAEKSPRQRGSWLLTSFTISTNEEI